MSQQPVIVNVHVSGGHSHHHSRHHGHRSWPHCGRPRYAHWWYWLFFLFVLEGEAWMIAGVYLAIWWLLWIAADVILEQVSKRRAISAKWGPFMDSARPVWPKRKPAMTGGRP